MRDLHSMAGKACRAARARKGPAVGNGPRPRGLCRHAMKIDEQLVKHVSNMITETIENDSKDDDEIVSDDQNRDLSEDNGHIVFYGDHSFFTKESHKA